MKEFNMDHRMGETTPARRSEPRDGQQSLPAGEDRGIGDRFDARRVAEAFAVDIDRVERAMQGEFGLNSGDTVDSRQAQHLSEVIIGDAPMDEREAAMMRLGAFTPRADVAAGVGDMAPPEEQTKN